MLNNDLVAIAWVSRIPAVAALATQPPVGGSVPADATSWAATGFIEVLTTGGSPDPEYRRRRPVVTAFCWAVKIGSKKPPWSAAGRLAEYIFDACYTEHLTHALITPVAEGITYPTAQIQEVNAPLSEPRKVPNDPAGYARYMIDFEMMWVQP
jgi:hypothetical protein